MVGYAPHYFGVSTSLRMAMVELKRATPMPAASRLGKGCWVHCLIGDAIRQSGNTASNFAIPSTLYLVHFIRFIKQLEHVTALTTQLGVKNAWGLVFPRQLFGAIHV